MYPLSATLTATLRTDFLPPTHRLLPGQADFDGRIVAR